MKTAGIMVMACASATIAVLLVARKGGYEACRTTGYYHTNGYKMQ